MKRKAALVTGAVTNVRSTAHHVAGHNPTKVNRNPVSRRRAAEPRAERRSRTRDHGAAAATLARVSVR